MRAITEESRAKDFMTTIKHSFSVLIITLIAVFSTSCGGNDQPPVYNQIPNLPVSIIINTDLPSYIHLKNVGTYVYEPGGSRGVLVIHNFDDRFYAFERTCTFQPDLQCSHIYVDSIFFNLRCGLFEDTTFVPCCDSKYGFDGIPTQSPATFPLKQYSITQNGSILTVRN